MEGLLFRYDNEKNLSAFLYGNKKSIMILIAGLTGGFLCCDYWQPLSERLLEYNISTVQVHLSSSYNSYGISSLLQTGCQDIIKYLKTGDNTGIIRGCFLQGPVSDRESGMFLEKEKINYYVPIAKELIKNNKSDELMPRNAEYIPITAYRYYSLYGVNGDDDYFSSDLSDEKFIELFQHIKVPVIFIESENDQFIPPSVNKLQHIQRMASFIPMNLGKYILIPNTDHGVTNNYEILINYIVDYIKRRTPLI